MSALPCAECGGSRVCTPAVSGLPRPCPRCCRASYGSVTVREAAMSTETPTAPTTTTAPPGPDADPRVPGVCGYRGCAEPAYVCEGCGARGCGELLRRECTCDRGPRMTPEAGAADDPAANAALMVDGAAMSTKPPAAEIPAPTPARPERVARMPEGLPATPCVLRAWHYASALSALYFGLPVYLVGGALNDPDPRDVDLVIPMPDGLFLAAYNEGRPEDLSAWQSGERWANPSAMWRRWARDCAKSSRHATQFCMRRVDFKVQPESYFASYAGKPRVRLDCGLMPEPGAAAASPGA